MTVALTLPQAANFAADNLFTKYVANTLKTSLAQFWTGLKTLFDNASPTGLSVNAGASYEPLQNWLSLIAALEVTIPAVQPKLAANAELQYDVAVAYVYRICYLGNVMLKTGFGSVGAQMLALYNTCFG